MRESVEVEVSAELVIDSPKQIPVERCGDFERIVVREQQLALRLDEVGAKKERVTRTQRSLNAREQIARQGGREISDVGTEKQHDQRSVAWPMLCGQDEPLFVRHMMCHHGAHPDRLEAIARHIERGLGNVDQLNEREPITCRARQQRDLLAAAATQFRETDRPRKRPENLAGMANEHR